MNGRLGHPLTFNIGWLGPELKYFLRGTAWHGVCCCLTVLKSAEEKKEYLKEYGQQNRQRLVEYRRAYYARPEVKARKKVQERHNHLLRKFGISPDEYARMLTAQGGICFLCRQPETYKHCGKTRHLAVDHCHKTGKARKLLCTRCNVLVGHGEREPGLLERAQTYIRSQGLACCATELVSAV